MLRVSESADVRQAAPADAREIRELLTGAQLPIDDLDRADVQFWVAERGSPIIGAIGLERAGAAGRLRSFVVARSARRHGIGRALLGTLEREARETGVEQLVLLTQTAESFFRCAGYGIVGRVRVPEGIRALEEFRMLCPASAVCTSKRRGGAERGVDD